MVPLGDLFLHMPPQEFFIGVINKAVGGGGNPPVPLYYSTQKLVH
jgi:hypothetical protein